MQTFCVEIALAVEEQDVKPADPSKWIRGTRWTVIKGHATAVIRGTTWVDVRRHR